MNESKSERDDRRNAGLGDIYVNTLRRTVDQLLAGHRL
jgi:hypothetical protein